jgi:hypothetical protein
MSAIIIIQIHLNTRCPLLLRHSNLESTIEYLTVEINYALSVSKSTET